MSKKIYIKNSPVFHNAIRGLGDTPTAVFIENTFSYDRPNIRICLILVKSDVHIEFRFDFIFNEDELIKFKKRIDWGDKKSYFNKKISNKFYQYVFNRQDFINEIFFLKLIYYILC